MCYVIILVWKVFVIQILVRHFFFSLNSKATFLYYKKGLVSPYRMHFEPISAFVPKNEKYSNLFHETAMSLQATVYFRSVFALSGCITQLLNRLWLWFAVKSFEYFNMEKKEHDLLSKRLVRYRIRASDRETYNILQ